MKILAKTILNYNQIEARKDLGVDGIDILLSPASLNRALLEKCCQEFDAVTVEVGDRLRDGVPCDPLHLDLKIREESRAYINQVLEYTNQLRISAVTIHLIGHSQVLSSNTQPKPVDKKEILEEAQGFYSSLGTKIVLENTIPLDYIGQGCIAYFPIGKIIDDFNHLQLPFCLDIAHLGAAIHIFQQLWCKKK